MSIRINILLNFIYVQLNLISCAKILAVFPAPSVSHQIVFRTLTHELLRRGHEITVITTDPAFPEGQAPINLTEIDVHDISYEIWIRNAQKIKIGNEDNILSQLDIITKTLSQVFEAQVTTVEVQNIINKKMGEFDLLILEAFVKPILAFTHIFKVPTIQISSFSGLKFNYEVMGAPTHPLLYPTTMTQRVYNLSNYDKLQQLYKQWIVERSYSFVEHEDNKLLKNIFGQDFPNLQDLYGNVDMLFLNIHSIWFDNQPVPPSVVFIGGIHTRPRKILPRDLEAQLNASKNGVIYFSLGTNVKPSHLPREKVEMMVNVFSKLPYDIFWKWDLDSMPGITDNIKIYKWLPQSDLLRHPKVKLFITQGGLQSTDEAIDAGVPLIGIPMIADQWYNTEKYVYHKIGMKFDFHTLTEDMFEEAIKNVITDESYRKNIRRLRSIMRDEPQKPLERAVWWTEYVLRHGGAKHLRAAGANITWAQYLELELVAIVLLTLFCIIAVAVLILYYIKMQLLSLTFWTKIKKA